MNILRAMGMLAFATVLVSIMPVPSCADSWLLPKPTTYTSANGQSRLTVTPRDLESQLKYFDDKVKKADRAGQKKGGARQASARLERLIDNRWQLVWEHQLANDVAPVSALVRDDGAYSVTFDDWHGLGYGPNVVVIYGHDGKLLRALTLSDVVPLDYIEVLTHSASSIRWRRDPKFSPDGRQVIIPVAIPAEHGSLGFATVDILVDLADGKVSPSDPAAWNAALEAGRSILAARRTQEKIDRATFVAPLLGPKINTEAEWHAYLREAVKRLIGDKNTPNTTVLRLPGAEDYAVSEASLNYALTEHYSNRVALASLSEEHLLLVLNKLVLNLPDRSLSNVTVFIALSKKSWPAALAVMKRTGAKIVQIDPAKAIPQRRERISHYLRVMGKATLL